jgi:UDP-glucose 4-epimerase
MIVVTGCSGFIGSHLMNKLIEKYNYSNVIGLTSKETHEYQYIKHIDYEVFSNSRFSVIDANIVIHAGAFIPKNNNDANNIAFCNKNIINTTKLLENTNKKLKKFIFLSTIDVYDDAKLINENSFVGFNSMYGLSKLYCEKMILAWGKQNEVDVLILRIGHVYGPGEEKYQKLIPETIRRILKGENIEVWGSGEDLRAFIHVDDVINSILESIEKKTNSKVINIVSSESYSINETIKTIIKTSGKLVNVEYKDFKGKSKSLRFNNDVLKQELYEPKISFEEGILSEWIHIKSLYENNSI